MNNTKIVIDGKDLILGRLCSHIAKEALLGKTIAVVNVGDVVITGKKKDVFGKFKHLREMGEPTHGPFIKRRARELFKRSVRRMLPYKNTRGKEALSRITAFKGVPARFESVSLQSLEGAHISKLPTSKYVRLQDVTHFLGGK